MYDFLSDRLKYLMEKIDRDGVDKLHKYIFVDSDFCTAPASIRYHDNEPSGLIKHSLEVYDKLREYRDRLYLEDEIPEDSLIITSLFHDICKCNCYEPVMRWTKVDGKWEQYQSYEWNEETPFGGHGSKSVYILQSFIPLKIEEAQAINCHMGFASEYDKRNISDVFSHNPLAFYLHIADSEAVYSKEWSKKEDSGC